MNRHLNIFHPYTKIVRKNQLENDLTRALSICLQEDNVFFNAILKSILSQEEYRVLFSESNESKIEIDIQRDVQSIDGFNKLYAVSISGFEMDTNSFLNQIQSSEYNPITDLIILINDIAIIAEVKPNNSDCANQLYTQAFNTLLSNDNELTINDVIPVDLNWKKLMEIAVQTKNFKEASNKNARFLSDFIEYIRDHNHLWLPVSPFASLPNNLSSENAYRKRLNSVLAVLSTKFDKLEYTDRMGLKLNTGWAQEIVFNFHNYKKDEAAIWFGVWPGNTKGQGSRMYNELDKNKNWHPPSTISLLNHDFKVKWGYEIKFCHFNRYVSNLIVTDDLIRPDKTLISRKTHDKCTGKYNRDRWDDLESFLDDYLITSYDWRKELGWEQHFLNSNRNYLTLSIGYQIETVVPVSFLQTIDTKPDELDQLSNLIIELKKKYENLFR